MFHLLKQQSPGKGAAQRELKWESEGRWSVVTYPPTSKRGKGGSEAFSSKSQRGKLPVLSCITGYRTSGWMRETRFSCGKITQKTRLYVLTSESADTIARAAQEHGVIMGPTAHGNTKGQMTNRGRNRWGQSAWQAKMTRTWERFLVPRFVTSR